MAVGWIGIGTSLIGVFLIVYFIIKVRKEANTSGNQSSFQSFINKCCGRGKY